jgi:uncharacterized protein (DUF58 family)
MDNTSTEFLKKIRAVELLSRKMVQDSLLSLYRSSFRGSGMQFKEFRNYVYGDDVRHISWNVSARTIEPVLKTFEEERDRTTYLIVDVSASLRRGPWAERSAETLALVAGTFALSAFQMQDKLGLLLFADGVEKYIPPAKGRTHLLRIIRDILGFEGRSQKTDPDHAIRQVLNLAKRRSVVIFLSDMEVLPDSQLLQRLSSKHDFIALSIHNPAAFEFPEMGFLEMESAELGRPITVDSSSPEFRRFLSSFADNRLQQLEAHFSALGADYAALQCGDDIHLALRKFLASRRRK